MNLSVIEYLDTNPFPPHSSSLHVATVLFVFNELGDHLESREWILFAENPGDELSGVIKTITKEGLVLLHL